jgi:hypothetical protein
LIGLFNPALLKTRGLNTLDNKFPLSILPPIKQKRNTIHRDPVKRGEIPVGDNSFGKNTVNSFLKRYCTRVELERM